MGRPGHFALRAPGSARSQDTSCGADTARVWIALILLLLSRELLFTVTALTGARISELCALTWADVRIDDPDDAEIEFGWQVGRHGNRRPTKTDGSTWTVPVRRELAIVLARHKLAVRYCERTSFVFANRDGPSCTAAQRV